MAAPAAQERDLRSLKEAAAYAGVHENTVRRWIADGKLADLGTPGKRLVDWAELVAFCEQGPTKRGFGR